MTTPLQKMIPVCPDPCCRFATSGKDRSTWSLHLCRSHGSNRNRSLHYIPAGACSFSGNLHLYARSTYIPVPASVLPTRPTRHTVQSAPSSVFSLISSSSHTCNAPHTLIGVFLLFHYFPPHSAFLLKVQRRYQKCIKKSFGSNHSFYMWIK